MALFEDSEGSILTGHSALGALQEAASLEGSQITRHHEIDLDRIESLNPTAMLDLEEGDLLPWGEDIEAEAWWARRQRKRRQWKRLDAWMPEEQEATDTETELPRFRSIRGQNYCLEWSLCMILKYQISCSLLVPTWVESVIHC